MALPKLVTIVGPTACGKTGMSIELAKLFGGEIISADSRQVYRHMDIGTAKVLDTNGIPHHLIDVIEPNETYTVSQFREAAIKLVPEIMSRGHVPFLVGGTAMYIFSLLDNWIIPEVAPNDSLREELESKSLRELQERLGVLDPDALSIVDMKNKRRVIRALEVTIGSGQTFSSLRKKGDPLFEPLFIGVDLPREELHRRIDARVDAMVKGGLILEIKDLVKKYSWNNPGMNGIGYRQFKEYTEGTETLDMAVERLKHDTKDYAKRQMTWFKRDERIVWCKSTAEASIHIKKFLS
jgi:tRNA dimethylallyltransferase